MKIIKTLILILLFNCQGKNSENQNKNKGLPEPARLIYSADDWSVQLALENDSIYDATESYIINEDNVSQDEAEKFIQKMINEGLLPKPQLSYLDEDYTRESIELEYVDFKRYIQFIKDSVAKQPEYIPLDWQ